ncbi:metallo-beta-lactamase superfamily protein [Lophiotrema nucula]|uniref:Metallo-beta-lactamase superfamily protein n=1 Tax=Lophiotrema nucula TaxID=690887 RepID=A0A6A5YJ07_9PLEO|nr:metallo-beta-lactamase superfamily protein [Lophiotrema nucula]
MTSQSSLNIPASGSTVRISIIDTSLDAYLPTSHFFGPTIKGFEDFHAVAYGFLVTHIDKDGKERRIVFDLGTPKDLENDFPPPIFETIKAMFDRLKVEKYVSEILTEHGISLDSIESVVWSHAHLDHVGRPSLFPKSTSLIVGPGVKEAYYPGYPANSEAPVLSREFEGREVTELDFSPTDLEIGGLKAIDYFGDGSFYFLSAPGHAIGHLNALARTTEGTFIYMGADSFHHSSMLRPHAGFRLPTDVRLPSLCCAGEAFNAIHPLSNLDEHPEYYQSALQHPSNDKNETPFHTISQTPEGQSLAVDIQTARNVIGAVQKFDADENVLVIAAHDTSIYDVLEYLPKEANDWKDKGWKEEGRWLFLQDLKPALDLSGALGKPQ